MNRWSIVIPHRADPVRDLALSYIRTWYDLHHGDCELIVGNDPNDGPWSKGAALRAAVAEASGDHLIVADGDVLVGPEVFRRCQGAVTQGAAWAMPHGTVYRLSRATTNAVYSRPHGDIRDLMGRACARPPHHGPPGGGIVVLSRAAFDVSGGIDPRFTDWGGEDISWARALDTLAGPCVRFWTPMWHLWHEPMSRRPGNRASVENEALAARYAEAEGKVSQMRALIVEHASVTQE